MEPAARLANRLLEREAWARERLAAHAGRVFVIVVGPIATAFRVDGSGLLDTTPMRGVAPDLTLRLSAFAVPAFLSDPARWDSLVAAEGDPSLTATLRDLALTLPWFVEQAFAKALGPVVGQRVADTGKRLLAFPEYVAERVGESIGSYARDEAGLLARGDEARSFALEAAALATRVDALATRLDAVEAAISKKPA
jgi:ubiquinone biosynthesis protein UbiJ